MRIANISFGANFNLRVGDIYKTTRQQVDKEITLAQRAREVGVSVPEYDVPKVPISISYQTKGETANFRTNPIENKHFPKLFNNIYLLDILNISHNDLEMSHCFYSEDGDVEFDCFRFGNYFKKDEINLPPFEMPNNLANYESTSLAFYVEQMAFMGSKVAFLRDYLRASSIYHEKRAEYIEKNLNKEGKAGVILTQEMLDAELTRAYMCRYANDDMANLLLKRLDFGKKQREAFTLWDEGDGACGHKFNKDKRIQSIPLYLEAVKSAIEYTKLAEDLSAKSANKKEKQYYALEAQVGKYYAETYIDWISGMANYNFVDSRVCPKTEKERREIEKVYNKIFAADFKSKPQAIDEYIEIYSKETAIKESL